VSDAIHFALSPERIEALKIYSEILGKDYNTMLDEALGYYFDEVERQWVEQQGEGGSTATHLSYDEFWDGVDV
jgi:predicted DNA-binding protein